MEKALASHSSTLAWRIPGTGEPGGLPSMGSHRVRHNWSDLAAYIYIYTHTHTPTKNNWMEKYGGKWFLTLKNKILLPQVLITFVMLGVSDCGYQIIWSLVLKKKRIGRGGLSVNLQYKWLLYQNLKIITFLYFAVNLL